MSANISWNTQPRVSGALTTQAAEIYVAAFLDPQCAVYARFEIKMAHRQPLLVSASAAFSPQVFPFYFPPPLTDLFYLPSLIRDFTAMPSKLDPELLLLHPEDSVSSKFSTSDHSFRTAPILTGDAAEALGPDIVPQRAVYGRIINQIVDGETQKPVTPKSYINSNAPFSAVVCGLQVCSHACLLVPSAWGTSYVHETASACRARGRVIRRPCSWRAV